MIGPSRAVVETRSAKLSLGSGQYPFSNKAGEFLKWRTYLGTDKSTTPETAELMTMLL